MPLVTLTDASLLGERPLSIPLGSGRYVEFSKDAPNQCVTESEFHSRNTLLTVLGDCDEPDRGMIRRKIAESGNCGTCGSSLGNDPVMVRIVGLSEQPTFLFGLATGKSYGKRVNGEQILVRQADAEGDHRLEPV